MKYDYDLVIIGQRPAAIAAADLAITWGARVALVMSSDRSQDTAVMAPLAISGIDLLYGDYEFVPRRRRKPRSGTHWRGQTARVDLQVVEPGRDSRSRVLRGRRYLLVPDACVLVPAIPGLDQTPHVTIANREDIRHWLTQIDALPPDQRPQRAIVYGGRSLVSLELAMTLQDQGISTHLISSETTLLTQEEMLDRTGKTETASLLKLWQLHAIANSLTCDLNCTISHVQWVGQELTLHTTTPAFTTQSFTADVLLIADGLVPRFDRVHLQACGLDIRGDHLWVDRYLRTTHPQIYACAAALRGHDAESIATHEALTATRNALTPWIDQVPNYSAIPWGITTRFGFARVGLNLTQARVKHPGAIAIDLNLQCQDILGSGLHGSDGVPVAAQVIVTATGTLIGATIIGDRTADLIAPFALAIGRRASINDWHTWAGLPSIATNLITETYRIWRDQWWQARPGWRDRVRSWFDDRRG